MTFFIACSSAVGLSGSTLNFHVLFYSLANFDRLLGEVFSARAERFVPACAPSQTEWTNVRAEPQDGDVLSAQPRVHGARESGR
ncbi:hypothetical protein FOMPIDRAFT_1052730 [Fomitopsis schrenkii]|uniref:Uncharacterized protein n=1 Tax=Fomitopsis schrenkii TaxID=2126942 RepID=S8DWP2_FOMSC|nr:hypothetical protein FOMPIDRAFT_1052730 [Fomitopsis schrenkii]